MAVIKRGNTYYVDYYYQGKRIREAVGSSRQLALTVFQKRKVEIAEGKFLDLDRGCKILFKDFAQRFLEKYSRVEKKGYIDDERALKHLTAYLGHLSLKQITQEKIHEYRGYRKEQGAKESTINRDIACLKTLYNKAVEWGYTRHNPAQGIKKFSEDQFIVFRFLTPAQADTLISQCHPRLKDMVTVALQTGLRLGNIQDLTKDQVDFHNNVIRITKNTKSKRAYNIPMTPQVREILSKDFDFNFDPKNAFKGAVKRSGLEPFRFHDLRHTFATWLVTGFLGKTKPMDIYTVSKILGHSSVTVTEKHYGHIADQYKQDEIKRMDTFWTKQDLVSRNPLKYLFVTTDE